MGNICHSENPSELFKEEFSREKGKVINFVQRYNEYWKTQKCMLNDDMIAALRDSYPTDVKHQKRFGQEILLRVIKKNEDILKFFKRMGDSSNPLLLRKNLQFLAQARRIGGTFNMVIANAERFDVTDSQLIFIGRRHHEYLPDNLPSHYWQAYHDAILEVVENKMYDNKNLSTKERLYLIGCWRRLTDYVLSSIAWAFYTRPSLTDILLENNLRLPEYNSRFENEATSSKKKSADDSI